MRLRRGFGIVLGVGRLQQTVETIHWEQLKTVDLTRPSLYSQECLRIPSPDENCPVFYRCPGEPAASYCANPRLVDLATGEFSFGYTDSLGKPGLAPYQLLPLHLNVFMLEDSYITGKGHVFNAASSYIHGGCQGRDFSVLLKGTRLTSHERMVSLLAIPPQRGHHLLHNLPLLFQVRRLLEHVPGMMVLVPQGTDIDLPLRILGLRLESWQIVHLAEADIIHGQQTFVPAKPPCQLPSASVWREFRQFFFNQSPLVARAAPGLTDPRGASVAPEPSQTHVVVLRNGLDNAERLATHLEFRFAARSTVITGQEPFETLLDMFSTANAVVGVATETFDLIIFMPPKATVVEVMPKEGKDWLGAHLCRSLGLAHKGLEGNSTASGELHVHPGLLASQLAHLAPPAP